MSVVPAIAAVENYYKRYVIACEYLQIDPSKTYEKEFVDQRVEYALSQWSEQDDAKQLKKLEKSLKWFKKSYNKLVSAKLTDFNFANRCAKEISKGKMKLHGETVNAVYQKREPAQTNYDSKKWYDKA